MYGQEMNLARYKYVVQVVIGEQRGEGVRMGSRCFWDSETDNVASETYINVRLRAVVFKDLWLDCVGWATSIKGGISEATVLISVAK